MAVTIDGVGEINGVTLPTGDGSIAKTSDLALVHINTTSFTAVSSVSLNDVFTSAYENYLVVFNIPTKVTNATLTLRLRASGTDTTTNYRWARGEFISSAASSGQEEDNSATSLEILFQEGSALATGEITFYAPFIANRTLVSFETLQTGATSFVSRVGGGVQTDSTAFDGISLITSAGTMTGNIRVYGYKNGVSA